MSSDSKAAAPEVKRQWGDLIFPRAVESPGYVGDGVYAGFDGFGVWLAVNNSDRDHRIYLEPEVLRALNQYAARFGIKP
jgi:hypothetical protein